METEAERQRDKETDLTESIIGDFFLKGKNLGMCKIILKLLQFSL